MEWMADANVVLASASNGKSVSRKCQETLNVSVSTAYCRRGVKRWVEPPPAWLGPSISRECCTAPLYRVGARGAQRLEVDPVVSTRRSLRVDRAKGGWLSQLP